MQEAVLSTSQKHTDPALDPERFGPQTAFAYLSGGGELGGALTPGLLSSELLGSGLAAEAVSAAAVGQARPAPHPPLQPIRLQPEPAGKQTLCTLYDE
jgi:hypothetical protein